MGSLCSSTFNDKKLNDDGCREDQYAIIKHDSYNSPKGFTNINQTQHDPEDILDDDFETELVNTALKYVSTIQDVRENRSSITTETIKQLVDQVNEELRVSFDSQTIDWEPGCRENARKLVTGIIFNIITDRINKPTAK